MDRAYQSGAVGSAPAAPASPSTGYPTAGNPGTGTPATAPGPYWYHMIMEELLAVIGAAGLTPAQGNLTQLLTALRSAGVFQTAPQFDNDTSVATTEFVQRALGNFSSQVYYTSGVIPADAAGKSIGVGTLTPGGVTITLPSIAALPYGAALPITSYGSSYPVTLAANGADKIRYGVLNDLSSIIVNDGDSATFIKATEGKWVVVAGTVAMRSSKGDFANSLAANGYQKLPSGLIVQWVYNGGSLAANTGADISWPIAFPNAVQAVLATPTGNANDTDDLYMYTRNKSVSGVRVVNGSAVVLGGYNIIAIGY